jgi:protein required for attachment to host cells
MTRKRWVAVADERVGRLLRVERTERGGARVAAVNDIRNAWEEHEHGRPSPRAGRNGHTYASEGHEAETMRDRFAKDLATWLEREAALRSIDEVALFAPPRLLGALRGAWSMGFSDRVRAQRGELAHLPESEIARHRSITRLIDNERA